MINPQVAVYGREASGTGKFVAVPASNWVGTLDDSESLWKTFQLESVLKDKTRLHSNSPEANSLEG